MQLDKDAIVQIVEKHRLDTSEVVAFQSWLQAHTEISAKKQELAKGKAMDLANAMLPADKVRILKSLAKAPLASAEIVQESYQRLQTVLNGRNANSSIMAAAGTERRAWEWLASNDTEANFKRRAWDLFKSAPNSIMIVDAPADGDSDPYIAFRDISKLHAVKFVGDSDELSYAIFKESSELYTVYTTEVYGKLERVGNDWAYTETPHGLGSCPARFFWTSTGDSSMRWIKQTAVLNQLPALDMYNYNSLAFSNQTSTSIFPMLKTIAMDCGYTRSYEVDDHIVEEVCAGGNLLVDGMDIHKRCPACGGKSLSGAGAVIELPLNQDGEGPNVDPNYIAPPIADVEFQFKKLHADRANIITSVTGSATDVGEKVAINKAQVGQNNQVREAILKGLSANFSAAQSWAIQTLLRLYLRSNSVKYEATWGTEFFMRTETELLELIEQAQALGLVSYEMELRTELMELKHSQNPDKATREKILKMAEPFATLSKKDAQTISRETFVRKTMFREFVREYEQMYGRIGSIESDATTTVARMKLEFDIYVQPFLQTGTEQSEASGQELTNED